MANAAVRKSSGATDAPPPWVAVMIQRDETYRFEALTLLEQARTRLAEIEAKPAPDASAVAVAVLHPMHLIAKALLAAKGYKAYSTRAAIELLRRLYAETLPKERVDEWIAVQRVELQGQKALAAARALVDTAGVLLTRSQ